MPSYLHNRKYLKERRQALRNNLTSAEATLWIFLKGRQLEGKKFRRQPSIGNYIVDFYCPEEQLVIELDGGLHDNPGQAATDRYRQAHLEDLGFTVLRFPNEDIFHAMDAVLNKIKAHWREAR